MKGVFVYPWRGDRESLGASGFHAVNFPRKEDPSMPPHATPEVSKTTTTQTTTKPKRDIPWTITHGGASSSWRGTGPDC